MGGWTSCKNEYQGMSNYLADTTVLIDHLRGEENAAVFLEKFSPYISTVTIAELIQGSKNKRDQVLAIKICETLPQLNIDKKISDAAIELMGKFCLSHGLNFLDALIAATAMENKLILVTGNLKHFKFIAGLKTISQNQILTVSN